MNQEDSLAQEQEKKSQDERILEAMKRLSEKEVYVVRNRVMADKPLTLREIGDHLKLSRERVRQIEGEALRKLKMEINNLDAHASPNPSPSCFPIATLENSHAMNVSLRQKALRQQTLSSAP